MQAALLSCSPSSVSPKDQGCLVGIVQAPGEALSSGGCPWYDMGSSALLHLSQGIFTHLWHVNMLRGTAPRELFLPLTSSKWLRSLGAHSRNPARATHLLNSVDATVSLIQLEFLNVPQMLAYTQFPSLWH